MDQPRSIANIMKSMNDPFATHIHRKLMKFDEGKPFFLNSLISGLGVQFVNLRNVFVYQWDEDDMEFVKVMYYDYMEFCKDRKAKKRSAGKFVPLRDYERPRERFRWDYVVAEQRATQKKRELLNMCREWQRE